MIWQVIFGAKGMVRRSCIAMGCFALSIAAQAQSLIKATVVQFGPGISQFHWAGQSLTLVSAWRENNNAHGYNVVSIFANISPGDGTPLQAVPIFERTDASSPHETLTLATSGGADCTLRSFRLYHFASPAPLMLVIATRTMGNSYADTQPVYFDFYTFKVDHEGVPGFPPYSFVFDHRIKATKPYCDVDEAFRDELGAPVVKGARLPWAQS